MAVAVAVAVASGRYIICRRLFATDASQNDLLFDSLVALSQGKSNILHESAMIYAPMPQRQLVGCGLLCVVSAGYRYTSMRTELGYGMLHVACRTLLHAARLTNKNALIFSTAGSEIVEAIKTIATNRY